MTHDDAVPVTRLHQLQQEIDLLANLRTGGSPIISCYLDLSTDTTALRTFLAERLVKGGSDPSRPLSGHLDDLTDAIMAEAEAALPPKARGIAVFAAADGAAPIIAALPFAAPFPNALTIAAAPDLLPLLQLKTLFGRFMVVLVRPQGLQLADVNLGDVVLRAWVANPLPQRRDETPTTTAVRPGRQPLQLLERFIQRGGGCPLFLAGDRDMLQDLRDLLSPASVSRLAGILPMRSSRTLAETAGACLQTLREFEAAGARELATRVLHGVRHHGPAVAGAVATIDALRSGSVDTLLIGSCVYGGPTDPGTMGGHADTIELPPLLCPALDDQQTQTTDLRVELARLAARYRVPVRFSDDDGLAYLGGIACLLRAHPQSAARPRPAHYGDLDLVA